MAALHGLQLHSGIAIIVFYANDCLLYSIHLTEKKKGAKEGGKYLFVEPATSDNRCVRISLYGV